MRLDITRQHQQTAAESPSSTLLSSATLSSLHHLLYLEGDLLCSLPNSTRADDSQAQAPHTTTPLTAPPTNIDNSRQQ